MLRHIYQSVLTHSSFYAALADETRLRLLHLMSASEVCVCNLQRILGTNQPKISRHLAYLRRLKLVKTRRDGRWIYYQLALLKEPFGALMTEAMRSFGAQAAAKRDLKRHGTLGCGEALPSRGR